MNYHHLQENGATIGQIVEQFKFVSFVLPVHDAMNALRKFTSKRDPWKQPPKPTKSL